METEKKCERCEKMQQAEDNLRKAVTNYLKANRYFGINTKAQTEEDLKEAYEFIRVATSLETEIYPGDQHKSILKQAINNLCQDLKQLENKLRATENYKKDKKIKTGDKVFTFKLNSQAASFLRANGVTVMGSGRFINFGDNCTFGKGTIIRGSAKFGDNCIFGDNCDIGDMVEIEANCNVADSQKIDDRSRIPANTVIPDSRFWR